MRHDRCSLEDLFHRMNCKPLVDMDLTVIGVHTEARIIYERYRFWKRAR